MLTSPKIAASAPWPLCGRGNHDVHQRRGDRHRLFVRDGRKSGLSVVTTIFHSRSMKAGTWTFTPFSSVALL